MCIGSTIHEFIVARGAIGIWSADIMGPAAFHAICMIGAAFLLAQRKVSQPALDDQTVSDQTEVEP